MVSEEEGQLELHAFLRVHLRLSSTTSYCTIGHSDLSFEIILSEEAETTRHSSSMSFPFSICLTSSR